MTITIFTDGASRGNPGRAAIGAVAYKNDSKLFELSESLGVQTNNYAEYMAVIKALEEILARTWQDDKITFFADSKLLVEQLNGNWKVKNENIKPLYGKAKELLQNFDSIKFVHIRREKNKEADALANRALDENNTLLTKRI